jgi:gamma-glutamyl hercynylcysteine S-oxide hydrolase
VPALGLLMCRHIAWLGTPRTLDEVILAPPHGLLVQSYAPRRQAHGLLNGDGWGVGFYPRGLEEPARWRASRPLWNDASFASVAPTIASSCVIGAVRSATPGMPIEDSAVAPFARGRWLLSHNGRVDRSVLPVDPLAESTCDSALLAALVFSVGPERLGQVVTDIGRRDPDARLNLLAVNGSRVIATTWGDTLSYLVAADGVVVASEPYDDDPGWVDVPDRHLVDVTNDGVSLTPLHPALESDQ